MGAARALCSDFLPVIGTVVVNLILNLALNLVLNFSMRKPHTIYLILNRRMLREIRKHPKTKKACFLEAFFENLSEHGSIRHIPRYSEDILGYQIPVSGGLVCADLVYRIHTPRACCPGV